MSINVLLERLEKVKPHGKNKWLACCPAHPDKTPSLALTELHDGRILVHCFSGCDPADVMTAVGLSMTDLFPDGGLGEFRGWEQLKQKSKPAVNKDKLILEMAKEDRALGKRLSATDLEIEKQAFMRERNANHS